MAEKRGIMRERIVRTLLNYPDGSLTKYKLAKLAECKFPRVHGLLSDLEKEGLVEGTKVKNFAKLLDLWRTWKLDPEIRSYMIQNPLDIIKKSNLDYALTTYQAENLVQRYLFPTRTDFYIHPEDKEKWHQFLAKKGLVGGGNTRILIADKHVEFNSSKVKGLTIVSKPQLIVDLLKEGGHCADAANQLMEKEIAIQS